MNSRKFIGIVITTSIIVFSVFGIYFYQFHEKLSNSQETWGVFGDFVGGTLNPLLSFFGFMVLLYTIWIQHEQLENDKIIQKQQKFESTFFTLFELHNRVLTDMLESKQLQQETNEIWNLKLDIAKTQLKDKIIWGRYSRILYSLLKFIAVNSPSLNKDEKIYSDMVKLLLTDDVMKLLVVECHCDNDDYKSLIEKYTLFENASFNKNLSEDAEEEKNFALGFHLSELDIYEAKKFYDKKAFVSVE